jgi:tRNA/rRNA methyltransferase
MITIVLVEPKGEENIGAVSRAMMNMNVSRLILVNPLCDHLSVNSLNYAVHSKEILSKAVIFMDLKSALENSDISIAISRRKGSYRRKDFVVKELPVFLEDYLNKHIYLVFGREANGLTNDEIMSCDLICSIPSSDVFPSINLSHSVMIVLYEIFSYKNMKDDDRKNFDLNEFNSMIEMIYSTLYDIDFFKNNEEDILKSYIRKILLRTKLEDFDIKLIRNIFKSIKGIAGKFKRSHTELSENKDKG